MALTKISTDGVKDNAITKAKIPADQIEASELANNAVDTNAIQDEAVTLAKLPHGDANNNGKFLRANNGADPSFEDVPAGGISDVVSDTTPQLGGDLESNGHDIKLANSDKIILGTGNDAEIFHNDTDFHIDAEASGATRNIYITGGSVNEKLIEIRSKDNEPHIRCYGDDMVQLYHNNAEKLRTMTNGIRVQGGIMFGSDSADANVLDDYEEGVIDNQNFLNGWGYLGSDPGNANAAPTMGYNGGKYVKIGSMVYVHMRISIANYYSIQGTMVFGIMPFYADRGGTESLLESHLGCWINSGSSGCDNVYAHTYGSSKYYYGIGKRTSSGHSDFTGPNGGGSFDCSINGWYRIE